MKSIYRIKFDGDRQIHLIADSIAGAVKAFKRVFTEYRNDPSSVENIGTDFDGDGIYA